MGERVNLTAEGTRADPFAASGPRWFTIAAHRPFLADLAVVLHRSLTAAGPEALADAVVLTPTRARRARPGGGLLPRRGRQAGAAAPHPRARRPRRGRAAVRAGRADPGPAPRRLAAAPPLRAGAADRRARRARARAGRGPGAGAGRRAGRLPRFAAHRGAAGPRGRGPAGRGRPRPALEALGRVPVGGDPAVAEAPGRARPARLRPSAACACCGCWPSSGTPSRRASR